MTISWADLKAGQWTASYRKRPCAPGLLAVGRRWPEWRRGTPPTWAEFVSADEIAAGDRCWLVSRVLLRDRRRLVAWAVDCAESAEHRAGKFEAAIRTYVIAPLRAWVAGDDSVDLRSVRRRAWEIDAAAYDAYAAAAYATAAYAAAAAAAAAAAEAAADEAAAAAYSAAAAAAYAAAAAAADAEPDAAASLRLALPHLAAVMEARS